MLLTMEDKRQIDVVQKVQSGKLSVDQGAMVLGRSVRTVYRLLGWLDAEGIVGLVHGNRGRPSSRRTSSELRERLVDLARGPYHDVNDTHLVELLARREGITIGRETLRSLLRAAGVAPKRRRRPTRFRRRRERKPAFGMMLQLDASPHDWLEGRGPWLTLVGAIDDATNFRWARFVPAETTWAYLDLLHAISTSHGLPLSLYADRHSIFFSPHEPTLEEQLRGERHRYTQFGRAARELGIELIPAYSPQAKGRVERMWGVLQDRLVVELRLANARTLEEANAVLVRFLADYNARFRVAPAQNTVVFRPAPPRPKLDRICCLKDTRTVANDHTVSFEALVLQIPPSKHFHSLAHRKVEVLQLRDGSIEIVHKDRCVARFSPPAVARLLCEKPYLASDLKVA